jgi:hypothetical protein
VLEIREERRRKIKLSVDTIGEEIWKRKCGEDKFKKHSKCGMMCSKK